MGPACWHAASAAVPVCAAAPSNATASTASRRAIIVAYPISPRCSGRHGLTVSCRVCVPVACNESSVRKDLAQQVVGLGPGLRGQRYTEQTVEHLYLSPEKLSPKLPLLLRYDVVVVPAS
jgi:hypothetical protein